MPATMTPGNLRPDDRIQRAWAMLKQRDAERAQKVQERAAARHQRARHATAVRLFGFRHRIAAGLWLACTALAFVGVIQIHEFVQGSRSESVLAPSDITLEFDEPTPPARPSLDLARLTQLVVRFHGSPVAEQTHTPVPESAPRRFPLCGFRPVAFIRHPSDESRSVLVIRSNDPAHEAVYSLSAAFPDKDAELVAWRREGSALLFDVRRCEESFTFRMALESANRGGILRAIPPSHPHALAARDQVITEGGRHARRAVRLVPFFAADGSRVGVRVSAVRPGTWADRKGLEPGDVIYEIPGQDAPRVDAIYRQLASGWTPSELRIQRREGTQITRLTLDAS